MLENLQIFLSREFLANTYLSYLYSLFFFAAALAGLYFVREIIFKKLKTLAAATETDLDDLVIELIGTIRSYEYQLIALYIALRHLNRTPGFDKAFSFVILLAFSFRAATMVLRLLNYWINKIAAQRNLSGEARTSVVHGAQVILKALVWVAAGLFVLDNLGVNVSAVLTGLGIGGVAVALAAQAILGDIFNFFVILLDKPFAIGDFVTSDTVSGTVEHIGLKSTRIRSLSGETVVLANSNLLASRIHNYKDLTKRRIVFKTGVVYGTRAELLRKIPEIIKKAVQAGPKAEFDRCNLYNCGDSSLDFETVYYLNEPDYAAYMAAHEQVLLSVIEGFAAAGAELAYPTRTVLLKK
ncbi:MAG: hypothetical protein A3J79_03940 [Elusimicrobia bacterium RIFOXYB2_FULL_62_6]|nr:MAG: hypothetical protein A3J79_03940 [Elusimicrobia bacterium RIFOXYB2_FULL_62_6]